MLRAFVPEEEPMRMLTALRMVLVMALLTFGMVAVAPVSAQDDTPVEGESEDAVDEARQEAGDVTDEVEAESDGFDDWGLLGLLGLAGLAGLMRRPQPVVHEVERTSGRVDDTRL
jgi:MYXO-CTERM domain-containing protein